MRIAISGSSGLIGGALAKDLSLAGNQIIPIVRGAPSSNPDLIAWDLDAETIEKDKLEGIDVVIHLAGESVASKRWSVAQKARIRSSRVKSTRLLAKTLASLVRKPKLLISASAIGIYGDRADQELTEDSPHGEGFLAEVGKEWETAAGAVNAAGIRLIVLRTGVVLSRSGGALAKMLLPFKLGLGGRLGSGKQWVSWIALEDQVAAIRFLLEHRELSGVFNLTAPNPVTNSELARVLGQALKRPAIFSVPEFALKLLLGEMAEELLLSSAKVLPKRLIDAGFSFKSPHLERALLSIL